MHTNIYASGFLYHIPTQQILLHQTTEADRTTLSLFTGKSDSETDGVKLFQSVIKKTLGISLPKTAIYSIYDYVHKDAEGNHFTFYAELPDVDGPPKVHQQAGWYTLKQLTKLKLSPQAKQDIIVGHRVILALEREKAEQEAPQEPSSE